MNKMCRSKIITTTIITAALLVLFGKGSFFTKTVYAKGENNVSGQTALAESDGSLSGTCGEGLTWTLENGTLTISGTGKMTDYVGGNHAPWYNDRNNINKVVICDGVTSIGAWAFWQCESLTSISIPEGVT
ncbi:hypothetical protein SAMN02910263_02670, partial [Butyrivibrio sp. INlla16]